MMKAFLVVSVVCVVASVVSAQQLSDEQKKRIIKNRDDCIKETKVDVAVIDKADEGIFSDDDQKLKCFTKCFYQKAGFVNDKGEVQEDVIKSKIPVEADRDLAIKIVELCKQEGKDPCDTVYRIHKCYFEYTHNPDLVKDLEKKEGQTESPKEDAKSEKKPEQKDEKKAEVKKDEKKA